MLRLTAFAERRLVRTWAMRGTLHLLPVDALGHHLALVAAARSWEKPAWQRSFLTRVQMDARRRSWLS